MVRDRNTIETPDDGYTMLAGELISLAVSDFRVALIQKDEKRIAYHEWLFRSPWFTRLTMGRVDPE